MINKKLKGKTHFGRSMSKVLTWSFTLLFLLASILIAGPDSAQASGTSRIAGSDRYLTAVAISQEGWKAAEYAVLARGDQFADALCAGPLAQKYNGPILLTQPNSLNTAVLQELKRLGVKHLFIVGGTGAISQGIEDALKGAGIPTIERIFGESRYETSVKIAEKIGLTGKVVLATGSDYPDALSISSIAAKLGMPILLSTKDVLPASVGSYLQGKSISQTYLVGGTGVLSAKLEAAVAHPCRIAGNDRYETNMAVLKQFEEEFKFNNIYVAIGGGPKGSEFADALTGAVLAAKNSSPLLLTGKTLPAGTSVYLKTKIRLDSKVTGLGGSQAVSAAVLSDILTYKNTIAVTQVYDKAGTYGPETDQVTIKGDVIISVKDVTLRNTVIEGDLLLSRSIGDGEVRLNGVTVKGKTIINGGGPNSVIMYNFNGQTVAVDIPDDANVRLVAQGATSIESISMGANGQLQEQGLTGQGFINVAIPAGAEVVLNGTFGTVSVDTAGANVTLAGGSIETMNVAPTASGAAINLASGTSVTTLNIDAQASISGQGQITNANVTCNGVTIEQTPGNITAPTGITVDIIGQNGNSSTGTTNGGSSGDGGGGGGGGDSGGPSDTTAPAAPVVTGISNGATVLGALPAWTDATGTTSTATLNGAAYTKGNSIHAGGAYTLIVTAKKTSNNLTASITVTFTVDNDGTNAKPYPILTPQDLNAVSGGVAGYAGWDLTKSYKLLADIDLSGYSAGQGWMPIGGADWAGTFEGSFDGNGFTIRNLYINRPNEEAVGLFGNVDSATIQNLTLTNVDINGDGYIGGIVGYGGNLTIADCSVTGDIKGKDDGIGGIAGEIYEVTISNCYFRGNVSSKAGYVGGLVGYSDAAIEYSYTLANVAGINYTGGLVGYNDGGTIAASNYVLGGSVTCADNSVNTGGQRYYGRITGDSDGGTVNGKAVAAVKFYANPIAEAGLDEGSLDFSDMTGVNGTPAAAPIGQSGFQTAGWDFTDTWKLDSAGNPVFKWQTADELPAVPFIRGVSFEAQWYNAEPGWTGEAGTTIAATLAKDGAAPVNFTSGTTIETAGNYELVVTATKTASGLKSRASRTFTIDRTLPTFTVTGVTNGGEYYAALPAPSWSSAVSLGYTATLEVGGGAAQPYAAGLLAQVAHHKLTVTGKRFTYPDAVQVFDFDIYGVGTAAAPFLIRNADELRMVDPSASNNNLNGKYYKLDNDIDLSSTAYKDNWTPLGAGTRAFEGHFDGNGHTISNLKITSAPSNNYIGLFSMNDGAITNLNLSNVNVNVTGTYVAGLVGVNYRGISNCTVSGTVSGDAHVGGLTAYNNYVEEAVISNCSSSVDVSSTGEQGAGGLVGKNDRRIQNCSASGSVTGHRYLGGLVGRTGTDSVITNSFATGPVTSNTGGDAGSAKAIGGLVGENLKTITLSYATGAVNDNGNAGTYSGAGGLVGHNAFGASISDSYATGNVTGKQSVGGISGLNWGAISKCYAIGNSSGEASVGGIAGSNFATVEHSFGPPGGPDAVTMNEATYTAVGWDFVTIWTIAEGVSYPTLR